MSLQISLDGIRNLSEQIKSLEKTILNQIKQDQGFALLKSAPGIGEILAETILLETGDIERFKSPGNYASYARCVESKRTSNGKVKGVNNKKNGNRYLSWAFIEAANLAIQHHAKARAFYQKKAKATNDILARKALAHKIARACYWILRKEELFDESKLFI